ncbi:MAG TPA: NAD(P)-dependent alcohol dehydrogenase [Microscillaceae bacterium]|nr:NAD(P)-dependent alcohol dehydrogenase [Microscillaceae bacterium]
MKASVYTQYGTPEVVHIQEVAKPTPGNNEIVVKVNATSMTAGDWRMRAGEPFAIKLYNGLRKPKRTILGHEFSGVVASVGQNVTRFKVGDPIFGGTGDRAGAHAQYVVVPEDGALVLKPENLPDADAAALPVGATTALFFLRKANIQQGQKVLIYGASGSVGTFAVQIAKYFGAEVTAVCSTANIALVQSLGADAVIDYTKEDFSKRAEKYDVVFDAVGKSNFSQGKKVLKPKGIYTTVAVDMTLLFQSLLVSLTGRYKLITGVSKPTTARLSFLTKLFDKQAIKVVIDRTYAFADIQKAHHHAQSGHKKGNIVVIP